MSPAAAAATAPAVRIESTQVERDSREAFAAARQYFYAYRILMNPTMLLNWWTEQVSDHMQQFYDDLVAGKRPKLALMAPPQHGKSCWWCARAGISMTFVAIACAPKSTSSFSDGLAEVS